jgi:molybdenum cofactor cytidylyltransferase/nicotine blue oxidoreductase
VLAADSGRRLGCAKALLRYQGTPLVERAIAVLREAGCAPVVVALGGASGPVRATADLSAATVVVNRGAGVGSALRAGLEAVARTGTEAVVLVGVDRPGLTAAAVSRVAALPHRDALVCGTYQGRHDYPMLLGRAHWSGISTLARVDVAVRPYLLAHAEQVTDIACDRIAADGGVDTPEDAAAWGIELPVSALPVDSGLARAGAGPGHPPDASGGRVPGA